MEPKEHWKHVYATRAILASGRLGHSKFAKHFSILAMLLALTCMTPASVPDIGDRYRLTHSQGDLMVESAQTWPYEEALIGKLRFDIATNSDGRVEYVGTNDPKFRTPEGLRVGSTLDEVMKAGGHEVVYETGWAHYLKLPSGWCAAFFETDAAGKLAIEKAPTSNSKVSTFFKRQRTH